MLIWIGAVCVVGGCSAIGFAAVRRLDNRVRLLSEWLSAIEVFQAEIRFKLTPLPDITKKLSDERPVLRSFFQKFAAIWNPWGEKSYAEAWQMCAAELDISRHDAALIGEIGSVLGRYDAQQQNISLEYIRRRLESSRVEAKEDRSRLGRMYTVLGVVSGLVSFMILL